MPFLQKMVRGKAKEIRQLPYGTIRVGRAEGSDVLLTAAAASKSHALIECCETHTDVTDLNSRNGTLVNGIRIKSCKRLQHRDILEFAGVTYVYLETEPETEDDSSGLAFDMERNALKMMTPLPDEVDPEQSIRRKIVRTGDVVSPEELIEHPGIEGPRVIASLELHDLPLGTWNTDDTSRKLSHVVRLSQAIINSPEVDRIDFVLRSLIELFSAASHALIAIDEESSDGFRIIATNSREGGDAVFLCHPLVRRSVSECTGLLVTDHWRKDPNEKPKISDLSRQSLLCVAIPGPNQTCQGVIQMQANDPRRPFNEHDLRRLAVLSHILAATLPGFRHLA
jgi:hypothetical protein